MKESIRVVDEVGKEVHHALTALLRLEDFNVIGRTQTPRGEPWFAPSLYVTC
jgi:hypothetical protein